MERNCALCGAPFQAQRASARYCSSSCRARKAEGAQPIELNAPTSTGSVTAATERELTEAERLDTALGQAAVALARRIDGNNDTGSAAAAMTKELRATLAEALKGAKAAHSAVEAARDELARRRAARGA